MILEYTFQLLHIIESLNIYTNLQQIIQAALVIRGLGIHGFDYSRVRKQGITANNKEIALYFSLI